MKRNAWLCLSLGLNIVLLGFVTLHSRKGPLPVENISPAASRQIDEPRGTTLPPVKNISPRETTQWTESLRAAGISEKLVADVAAADFESRWRERWSELQRKFKRGEVDSESMKLFHLQHDAEEEKELRALLGDQSFRRWDQERILRDYNLASLKLSDADTDALYQLRKGVEQQRNNLAQSALQGTIDEADYEKQIETAQGQFDQQAKTLLGDERYAMISDSNASGGNLKHALATMNITGVQTEAVLQADQEWNDQHAKLEEQLRDGKLSGADYEQQMQAINTARDQRYQQELGADGFAALQKTQDNRYRLMEQYAPAWGLSGGDIDNLYDTIQSYESSVRDYQARARAIEQQGQAVDWAAVRSALQEYSQQTEATLRKSLGDERFNKLKRSNVLAFGE